MSDPEHHDHSSVDVWEDEGGDNDDVWGNDDEISYDRAIAQKEWDRLHENFGNVRTPLTKTIVCCSKLECLFFLFLSNDVCFSSFLLSFFLGGLVCLDRV